jgi:hypothetical protein
VRVAIVVTGPPATCKTTLALGLGRALARQLDLGQRTIVEMHRPMPVRQRWRQMTTEAGHRFIAVECFCTDRAGHRARFAQCTANPRRRLPGWRKATVTVRRYQRDPTADFSADAFRLVAALRLTSSPLSAPRLTSMPRPASYPGVRPADRRSSQHR